MVVFKSGQRLCIAHYKNCTSYIGVVQEFAIFGIYINKQSKKMS